MTGCNASHLLSPRPNFVRMMFHSIGPQYRTLYRLRIQYGGTFGPSHSRASPCDQRHREIRVRLVLSYLRCRRAKLNTCGLPSFDFSAHYRFFDATTYTPELATPQRRTASCFIGCQLYCPHTRLDHQDSCLHVVHLRSRHERTRTSHAIGVTRCMTSHQDNLLLLTLAQTLTPILPWPADRLSVASGLFFV